MPKQITKTVYTFKEMIDGKLPGEERARQWMREYATGDEFWSEYTIETWKSALAQIGFEDADIAFSGFACQGDGASFTANVNMDKLTDFMGRDIEPKNRIEPTAETGDDEDYRPWILHHIKSKTPANRKYRRLRGLYSAEIQRNDSRYCHENTCEFWLIDEYRREAPRVEKLANGFERDAEQLRTDLCRAIYRDLEQEYFYQISDEAMLELAEANDYTFDKHGNREG